MEEIKKNLLPLPMLAESIADGEPFEFKKFRFIRVYIFSYFILLRYLLHFIFARFYSARYRQRVRRKIDRKNGERVRQFIIRQKGLFIKIGQFAGLLRTILTEDFLKPLEGLQDRITPQPFAVVESQLINTFGPDYKNLFESFDNHAMAAASIGQVHKATIIYQGEKIDVACKILYPFIGELVAIDLKSIKAIFRLVKFFLPHFRSESIYPQIVKIIKAEINLENEARNLEKIKENFQNEAEYVFPEVFHDLSNRRILTLRFITGIKITNIDELRKNQIEPKQIASLLIQAYAKQIFQHRFFHADPHPGNLLVLPGPKLAFLDFGACGEMKAFRRDALRKIIRSAMARDYFKVIEGLKELGAVPKTADMKILETAVAYAIEKISKMEREVTDITTLSFEELSGLEDLRYLNQFNIGLRDLMSAFDVPEGWVAVERVIAHVMAIIMEIAPESTLGSLAKPFLSKIILDDFNDLKTFIGQRGKIAAYNFFDLPQSFSNVLNQFSRGRIEMGIHGFDTTFQELVRVQKQVIISLFTGIFSFLAIYCYQSDMEYLFVNFALSAIFCLLSVGRNAFKKSPLSKGWSQSEGHYIHGFKLKSDDEI